MASFIGLSATSDAFKVERWITAIGAEAAPVAFAVIDEASKRLLDEIKKNASYAPWGSGLSPNPGPAIQNRQDPPYVDSWQRSVFPELNTGTTAVIGTDYPQGRRLEWGFVGTDSLGRHYHSRPFPHVGPALDVVEPWISEALITGIIK